MKCPICKYEREDNIQWCPKCYPESSAPDAGNSVKYTTSDLLPPTPEDRRTGKNAGWIMTDRITIRAVLCIIVAIFFFFARMQMTGDKSFAGDSIAEAFYQAMGMVSYGLALLSLAFAVPTHKIEN